MNDRFRFRAWHEPTKKLFRVHCFTGEYIYENTLNGVGTPTNPANTDDCVLEQCTGLKDENGTLIYEGDIVECFYDHFDGNFTEKKVTGVVKWGVGEWSVQNEKKGDWYFLSYANYDEKHLQSDSVKVIGNIHKNPELLEDK